MSASILLMLSFVLSISAATSPASSTVDSVYSAASCRLNYRFRKASSAYIDSRSRSSSFLSSIITFSYYSFSRIRASSAGCGFAATSCYSSGLFSCASLLRVSFFSSRAAYFSLLFCRFWSSPLASSCSRLIFCCVSYSFCLVSAIIWSNIACSSGCVFFILGEPKGESSILMMERSYFLPMRPMIFSPRCAISLPLHFLLAVSFDLSE